MFVDFRCPIRVECILSCSTTSAFCPFSYPEPFLRAVNRARRGALAKSISNWHLIGYNEGYCSNNVVSFTMFLWFPVLDLARAPRRTARKKGSGYENAFCPANPARECILAEFCYSLTDFRANLSSLIKVSLF